jgi:hypothetical protein
MTLVLLQLAMRWSEVRTCQSCQSSQPDPTHGVRTPALLLFERSRVCHAKLFRVMPGLQHRLQWIKADTRVRCCTCADAAPVPPAAEAQPGSGPADTPAALLQHLALRLEKGSPMHTRIMDLKEGLFQIGEPFSYEKPFRYNAGNLPYRCALALTADGSSVKGSVPAHS